MIGLGWCWLANPLGSCAPIGADVRATPPLFAVAHRPDTRSATIMSRSWPTTPLAAAQRAFDLLTCPPAPLAFDGRAFPGLPARLLPLDELKTVFIDDATPRRVRDEVWRELVIRARRDGPAWVVAAVGIAMPGLRRVAGLLAKGWRGDSAARAVKHARERDEDTDVIRVDAAWSLRRSVRSTTRTGSSPGRSPPRSSTRRSICSSAPPGWKRCRCRWSPTRSASAWRWPRRGGARPNGAWWGRSRPGNLTGCRWWRPRRGAGRPPRQPTGLSPTAMAASPETGHRRCGRTR